MAQTTHRIMGVFTQSATSKTCTRLTIHACIGFLFLLKKSFRLLNIWTFTALEWRFWGFNKNTYTQQIDSVNIFWA